VGKRVGYEPGTFCWIDLQTTDPAGAKLFYNELFGWRSEDMPVGDGTVYTMFTLDGDDVAAMNEMNPEQREAGVPPHWFSYISVENAAETAAKVEKLGGTVFGEAFDVLDAGRMAIIQDPAGATFAAWQPKDHIGAGRVNDTGCLAWNELQTRDPEAASSFYGDLFGWKTKAIEEDGDTAYITIENRGWMNGGLMPMSEAHGDAPSYWLPYFTVESCDGAVEKVKVLGGTVHAGPMEPGEGRIAVMSDPQGAVFAVFEGETDE
jgi:uncharacterized protein